MSVSNGNPVLDIAAKISDASISKSRIVCGDTTDTTNSDLVMKAATSGADKPLGVTTELTSASDQTAAVRVEGIAEIEVDGTSAIDIGDSIIASTGGKGVIAAAASATAQWSIGYALAPAAADGIVIPVLIDRHLIVKGSA